MIGVPAPARLAPAAPVDRLSPRTLDGAIARGHTEHPLITTATYNVDIAVQQVKVAEGALYPTLSAVGTVQKTYGPTSIDAVLKRCRHRSVRNFPLRSIKVGPNIPPSAKPRKRWDSVASTSTPHATRFSPP